MGQSANKDAPDAPSGTAWFTLLAAPAAWLVQLTASWLIVESACAGADASLGVLDPLGVRVTLAVISLVALFVAGVATFTSIRVYHRSGGKLLPLTGETRHGFLFALGILVSSVFFLAIFWAAWPLVTLPVCESMR